MKDLIDAGAQGFSKNSSGHTPFDLVRCFFHLSSDCVDWQ